MTWCSYPVKRRLTSGNVVLGVRTHPVYTEPMLVNHRDLAIIQLVARFTMLPSGSIRKIIFPNNSSNTSSDEALKRLVARKYLARVERRLIGGNGAGSGQYVYKLGTLGRKMMPSSGTARLSDVHHTMAIVDTYTELFDLERQGKIQIIGYATEPDSWCVVGGSELRPDLLVEVGVYDDDPSHKGVRKKFFIEVDLGTERQVQLRDKLKKYSDAWKSATVDEIATFPAVLFLVPSDERMKELKWLMASEEDPEVFQVIRQDQLTEYILM